MDIDLGKLDLTINQFERTHSLKDSKIKGFKNDYGNITVTVDGDLDAQEKQKLIDGLLSLDASQLPKTRLQELKEKPVLTLPEVTEVLKIHGLV